MRQNIILASASPRRKELLNQIGINPRIMPSSVKELITGSHPEAVVKELSAQKAADIAKQFRGQEAVVIGADTVVSMAGRIMGKPAGQEDAVQMLTSLQGARHQVYTGVTLIFCQLGKELTFAEKTEVEIYPMTRDEILQYVRTGEPFDKAGAYGIQGLFAAYIKGICGDYNNVVGLPVARVYQELKDWLT